MGTICNWKSPCVQIGHKSLSIIPADEKKSKQEK